MDPSDIFIPTVLTDKVRIVPSQLANNVREVILGRLCDKSEGRCTKHGYILPGSVELLKVAPGVIRAVSLNGDVLYHVEYAAKICNPAIGTVVKALITNINKFGILAQVSLPCKRDQGTSDVPVMEIIITKQGVGISGSVNLEDLSIGDIVSVEVLGKKFELNDTKIIAIGRAIEPEKMVGGNVGDISDNEDDELKNPDDIVDVADVVDVVDDDEVEIEPVDEDDVEAEDDVVKEEDPIGSEDDDSVFGDEEFDELDAPSDVELGENSEPDEDEP
jgi:DNA-directed RNA polymerase subunit E'/Rpb7